MLWVRQPDRADLPGEGAGPAPDADPAAAAAELVESLEQALVTGAGIEDLALTPSSRRELATLRTNIEALRLTELDLRFVDESDLVLSAAERASYAGEPWVADVSLTWRLSGVDPRASTLEVPLALDLVEGEATFATARLADEGRAPLWWIQRVAVARAPGALAVGSDRDEARRLRAQALTARQVVRRSLPDWSGPLVLMAPRDTTGFRVASGLSAGDAEAIAAVTTATDARSGTPMPVHVFLNPGVFDPLGPRGQQIVVSHEATHVALGAVGTGLPLWLSEGVADFVALRESRVPVSVLASQILDDVRRNGPPETLPGPAEFDGGNEAIGASYEAAWLAARLLADTYGADRLLRVYDVAERTGSLDRAFDEVLGTDVAAFTAQWRDHLIELAS